jgi:hypothetical protein
MPTGYTAPIQSGEITDFRDYALQCARAFGACVMMRDEPMDKPIPDEFQPSSYHAERLAAVRDELGKIMKMTMELCGRTATEEYTKACKDQERREAEVRLVRERYESMLAKARAYVPPSDDHKSLAEFMVSQLEESLKLDCSPSRMKESELLSPEAWKARKVEALLCDIEYHVKRQREEEERVATWNKWITDLRRSLA